MPTQTPQAKRSRKYRKRNTVVNYILFSVDSSNNKEENSYKEGLEHIDVSNAVFSSGYKKW